MNVKELNQTQTIEVYTCSKCGKPNARDPARCCINGDFNGVKIKVEIPKVTGKYYTEYFDNEDTEVIGRLIRSSEIKKVFQDYIYAGQQSKIRELFESLQRVYTIYREDKIHNTECEYAIGTSCICWCGEKYHGYRGKDAQFTQQK